MKLYENEISSASSRVRIALALKGLSFEKIPVGILGPDAENRQSDYLSVNPQGLVPALLTSHGTLITQSLAIIEYLDELHPHPALLPDNAEDRAFSRSVALMIAAEIHALLPPRIRARLLSIPGFTDDDVFAWNQHWIIEGMNAVELLLSGRKQSRFTAGDRPSIADLFLYPQAINTEQRLGIDLGQWPRIAQITTALKDIPAFFENAPTAPQPARPLIEKV
ncbi:maleylacetoacetate isomerase [Phyllobacterium sp. SB3]|uniref:maleylacetoacetate isomerase n=1 Tax=Phyllobacterium sp. SB3 TaxID=3156073 RepID=UPI0032AF3605